MNSKVCPACHVVNNENYKFCINCGTPLPDSSYDQSNGAQYNSSYNSQYGSYNNTQYSTGAAGVEYVVKEIDGVPIEHVAAYVGGNPKILKRFAELELTGEKSSWCWPVFVLGLFFGFIGASLWFFYRKVYKPAIALLLAGLVMFAFSTALSFSIVNSDQMKEYIRHSIDSQLDETYGEYNYFFGNNNNVSEFSEQPSNLFDNNIMGVSMIANAISLVQLVAVIVISMYAFTLYKKSAIERIKAYAVKFDREVYPYELQKVGGAAGGTVALLSIAYFVLSIIVVVIICMPMFNMIFSSLNRF